MEPFVLEGHWQIRAMFRSHSWQLRFHQKLPQFGNVSCWLCPGIFVIGNLCALPHMFVCVKAVPPHQRKWSTTNRVFAKKFCSLFKQYWCNLHGNTCIIVDYHMKCCVKNLYKEINSQVNKQANDGLQELGAFMAPQNFIFTIYLFISVRTWIFREN